MAKDNIKQVPRVIILFCYILVLFIINRLAFDMGCLLITQRTANVTKTILNQCNTIFAMRSFDKTGKDFLSDYMGREYAEKLSLLQERHAIFFGKVSSCENPVMISLNDRYKEFLPAFQEKHPVPDLTEIPGYIEVGTHVTFGARADVAVFICPQRQGIFFAVFAVLRLDS